MSNRRNVRKRRRERELSDFEDSEDEYYDRPRYRENDVYNYNMYDDRYNGWQDIYRPDYDRSYSGYDGPYRGQYYDEYDGYRGGYDDYRPRYDTYRPGYDNRSGYNDYAGYGGCKTCNSRRRGRPDDPNVYRYGEDPGRPLRRKEPRRHRKVRDEEVPKENNVEKSDMNVYAMPKSSGHSVFKEKKDEVSESTESEEESRRERPRKRRRRSEDYIRA